MPKKNPSRRAYELFVSDWKKKHENELSASSESQSEVLKQCETEWKSCPDVQKHYKSRAVQSKEEVKLPVVFEYTCIGQTYESKEAETKEIQDFTDNMIQEIMSTVNDISISGFDDLVNYRFYLIHANYYIEWTAEKKFIPCEVAIAEYSIAHGVHDILHFFPGVHTPDGKLPIGYAYEAKEKADLSHQIPPPPFELAEYNFLQLSSRVLNFLTRNGSSSIPPVYTMDDNMNCNHSRSTVLDFMELMRDFSGKDVRVHRLPLLFFELYNACSKLDFWTKTPFESEVDAEELLCVDRYAYVEGIACMFHTFLESEGHRFCSRSTVQRWAYILSESCCRKAGIEPIPGKHCPPDTSDDFSNITQMCKMRHEAGVSSQIRNGQHCKFIKGTSVRLPKTRGEAELVSSRQREVQLPKSTTEDLPPPGETDEFEYLRETEEPRGLTQDDFPALGARPRRYYKK